MVLWYQAAVAPGNLSASVAGACSTVITLTSGARGGGFGRCLSPHSPRLVGLQEEVDDARKLTNRTTATPKPKRRILCPVAADTLAFWGGIIPEFLFNA